MNDFDKTQTVRDELPHGTRAQPSTDAFGETLEALFGRDELTDDEQHFLRMSGLV